MAHSTATAGTYYNGTGPISFSSLRSNFRAQQKRSTFGGSESFATDNNPIKASQLRRVTSTTNTNPVVPNATENGNISTLNDWKSSQFRGSIKFYYIRQSSTNINVNINNLSWNSNRGYNINKIYFVDGTIGSNAVGTAAAAMSGQSVNLRLIVSGAILGAAGRGGGTGSGAPGISGQTAGTALSSNNNSNSKNVVIELKTGSFVAGGGGGGEKGATGAKGTNGLCVQSTTKQNCGSCPSCPSGWTSGGCSSGSGCENKQKCNRWGNCWRVTAKWKKYRNCTLKYATAGGPGGAGGNGGIGRGYNNQLSSVAGATGAGGGGGGGCGATAGKTGETGGNGGGYGSDGVGTSNTGSGGSAGAAITGQKYSVVGANTNTVKGSYT